MVKYIELDSIDEYGIHIHSLEENSYALTKLASNNFSKEIKDAIASLKREDRYYYVVINALGSFEAWGMNRNGDSFPRQGLSHLSLRSDVGTEEDYGYKTFEYHAHFFHNHVNKNDSPKYGTVSFSHWNPKTERVELIVGIDRIKDAEVIKAIESMENVAVSMGCLTDPEYPILTMRGYVPIKDVTTEDVVFTHAGNWKKVKEVRRRVYSGGLSKIHFKSLPIPIELTDDHPMMAKLFLSETENKKRPYIHDWEFEKEKFDWRLAGNIEKWDYVQYIPPVYKREDYCAIDSIPLAKIMGYYLAEGSFGYNGDNPCTIQLSCNISDQLPREVPKLMQQIYPGVTCSMRPHSVSKVGLAVEIFSTDLAIFLNSMMRSGSKNKYIPPEIFVSSKEVKCAYIGTWFNGDGWLDKKGMHISTANLNLALQGRDLLHTLGISSSIYKIEHQAGVGFSNTNTTEYTLNVSMYDVAIFKQYSELKMGRFEEFLKERLKEGSTSYRFNSDGTFAYSVKMIEKRNVESIQTYNIEVEDDESYSAAGLASHNCRVKYDVCSVCGHKAKTTKEYCKHLKNYISKYVTDEQSKEWSRELNKIILPGTAICAINEKPKFFDISKVYVGAEVTSYVLGKVASIGPTLKSADIAEAYGVTDELLDKVAVLAKAGQINKEADIDKEISGGIDGRVVDHGRAAALRRIIDEKLQKEIPSEETISNDILDTVSRYADLRSILSTMVGLGIHPKPREFQRIVIIKAGYPDVADMLDRNNLIFDPDEKVEPIDCCIDNKYFSDPIAKLLMSYMHKRSCFPDFLNPRLEKTASTSPLGESKILTPTNILAGVAAIFAGLKLKAMGIGPSQVVDIMASKPWIGSLLGGGLAYKLLISGGKSDIDRLMVPAQNYEDVFFNTYFSGHPMSKTASVGEAVALGAAAGLAALPAAYVVNAYNRKSQYEKGTNLFPGADVKPSNAAKIVGGGTALGYLLHKNYGKDLINKIKSLK